MRYSVAEPLLGDRELAYVTDALQAGEVSSIGSYVRRFEEAYAVHCGVRHALATSNGTTALHLALMASGVGPGDEVIVPSFTFFATASAVTRLGARLVFVDIEPASYNLDAAQVAAAITAKTRAIIPVHLFGQCAAMDALCELAKSNAIAVVEDAAQAIGARYLGRPAGSWGDVGCFSFYPTKNLGGCGDGGMLTTSKSELAERLRLLAAHGMSPRYCHQVVGINSRLDSIQAAALAVKFSGLEQRTSQRRANASRYQQLFVETGLDQVLGLPQEQEGCHHVWNQYTVRVPDENRDVLRAALASGDIGTEVYYPIPLHLQECFEFVGCREGSLPETERAAKEVLSLPVFPGLTGEEQQAVVGRIADFFVAAQAESIRSSAA